MKPNLNLQFCLDIGIFLIALMNAAGAIASKRYNFSFQYLILLSIIVYTLTGFLIARVSSLFMIPLCNAIFGCFDALMGWHFSMVLIANTGIPEDEHKQFTVQIGMLMKVILSIVFGYVGQLIAN